MEEDLARRWGKFSLTEEEDVDVMIRKETMAGVAIRGQNCIVGKQLAERFVGKEIIKFDLSRKWKPLGMMTFKVVDDNIFLIDFEHQSDKARVLKGRPWLFDDNVFAVEDFDGVTPPAMIDFEKVAFWVRMFNLPLACMGTDIGCQIGSTV